MRTDLDTKILEKLSERVERLCRAINDPYAVSMGKDWSWAELTHEALPELESYLSGANAIAQTPPDSGTKNHG
jgi:hypothetical protein